MEKESIFGMNLLDQYLLNKNLDLSFLNYKMKQKFSSKRNKDLKNLNISIKFKINKSISLSENFERKYNKKHLKYLSQGINSKIISMFFNYIYSNKVIPFSFKNNHYFLVEFLKIIQNLLINEIELVIMTLIFDEVGWISDGLDIWKYLYFITLAAKSLASSNKFCSTLLKLLNKYNIGFNDNFYKWINNSFIKKILYNIDIKKINERFRELRQPYYLTDNQKKFINYNEIANKIVKMPNSSKTNKNVNMDILMTIQSNNNSNTNLDENNMYNNNKQINCSITPLDFIAFKAPLGIPKQESLQFVENQIKQTANPPQSIDLQINNSIGGGLELNGNTSYIPFGPDEDDLYKIPTFPLNK